MDIKYPNEKLLSLKFKGYLWNYKWSRLPLLTIQWSL